MTSPYRPLVERPGGRVVAWRWPRPSGLALVACAAYVVVAVGFTAGLPLWPRFLLVAMTGAPVMLYAGASLLLDRTELVLDAEALELRYRPLPWPGRRIACRAVVDVRPVPGQRDEHAIELRDVAGQRLRLGRFARASDAERVAAAIAAHLRL